MENPLPGFNHLDCWLIFIAALAYLNPLRSKLFSNWNYCEDLWNAIKELVLLLFLLRIMFHTIRDSFCFETDTNWHRLLLANILKKADHDPCRPWRFLATGRGRCLLLRLYWMNFKLFHSYYLLHHHTCVYPTRKLLVNFQNNCPQLTQIVLNVCFSNTNWEFWLS